MSKAENPRAVPGDNSGDATTVAGDQVRAFIERIERIEEEEAALRSDKKDIYAELKGTGFDAPTIRKIVATRKKDRDAVAEQEALYDLYTAALGGVFA
jgi:uncharacterized protein (UPF0335 family)